MDRLDLNDQAGRLLHIRTGNTPVNKWFLIGSVAAASCALTMSATQSGVVSRIVPDWVTALFYALLLVTSAVALSGILRPLPAVLDPITYHIIVSRLQRERVGLSGCAAVLISFSAAVVSASLSGLTAALWLTGIAIGFFLRARQIRIDVRKLRDVMSSGGARTVKSDFVADPDAGDRPRPEE